METKRTLLVQGMMCMHCEKAVREALTAISGVVSAEVSHEKGTAIVTHDGSVADETLRAAVEAKDYKVTGIE